MGFISAIIFDGLELPQRLSEAISLARQAGKVVMDVAAEGITHQRKVDQSLVTNADHQSDQRILEGLQKAFPDDGILTEESGILGQPDSELVWVVDPLDGTKAFFRQIPGFSVMIGLLFNEIPVLGVVFDPLEGWLYYASKNAGAYAIPPGEEKPISIHVSDCSDVKKMPLICSPGVMKNEDLYRSIIEEVGLIPGASINSVGIKVGLLLRQKGDVYFNHHSVCYWDTVAPLLIAEEGGAKATFLDGRPFTYDLKSKDYLHQGPSIVTNGTKHEEFRSSIAKILDRQ